MDSKDMEEEPDNAVYIGNTFVGTSKRDREVNDVSDLHQVSRDYIEIEMRNLVKKMRNCVISRSMASGALNPMQRALLDLISIWENAELSHRGDRKVKMVDGEEANLILSFYALIDSMVCGWLKSRPLDEQLYMDIDNELFA